MKKQQIIDLLNETDESVIKDIFSEADRIRREFMTDDVHLRALIEFSNYCRRNCLYCGLRKNNSKAVRYRMTKAEIIAVAEEAWGMGFPTVVLQSGEDGSYTIKDLCEIIDSIKSTTKTAVTLSIGERSYEDYKMLKEAGADRYLLRFETSNPHLFKSLKPDSVYENRFLCLEWLTELGYQVGSGNMVGLPGQTMESLADDILKFNELELDMIGLGPYISHPDTPLRHSANGTIDMVLRVTALSRIITKNAHMPATTATGTIDPEGRQKALQCGANVLMPNLTPARYRNHYLLYPGKICIGEKPETCRLFAEDMLKRTGRTMSSGLGHSMKKMFDNAEE